MNRHGAVKVLPDLFANDVWAFGAVLYEMLSGRRPFEGDAVSADEADPPADIPRRPHG